MSRAVGSIALAAAVVSAAHYDGIVLAKRYVGAHPEWSWTSGAFVTIPACYMLEIGPDWTPLPDRICVPRDAYVSARWNEPYSGPGTPYAGSRL